MTRGRHAWAGAAAVVVVLAGCGADDAYVENADDSLYLKLPTNWVRYEEQEIYEEPFATGGDALSTLDIIREVDTNWLVGFGGDDLATPSEVLGFAANTPVGFTAVVALVGPARESFDVVAQRSFGWPPLATGMPLDPVAFYRENPRGDVEVFAYEEFEVPGRGHGTRVRAGFDGIGDDTVIRDITVVLDALSTEVYVLSVGCYAHCFLANAEAIDDVVSSFTLEDLG